MLHRPRRRKVPEPGEALHSFCNRIADTQGSEVQFVEREHLVAENVATREQCIAPLAIALDVIARDRDELERLASRREQPRKEGALGQLLDDGILCRCVCAHQSPLSALMFAA